MADAPMRAIPPLHVAGMRIGLFGGSFNPPHAAHRAASLFALKRLGLDRVWWLVSPGNPLKDVSGLRDLDARVAAARGLAADPRIVVTPIEAILGTHYTADTLRWLTNRSSGVEFVWLMGADNLIQFHRWRNWRAIAQMMPIAVIDRPPHSLRAIASPAALALSRGRMPETEAKMLPEARPPAWVFLTGMKSAVSSSSLRDAQGRWRIAAPALDD